MKRSERGFTLIELMISLLISTLLVVLILSIFARLSFAYREQQDIAGVTQKLTGARQLIELDAKQAGLEMAQGFKIASDGSISGTNKKHSPVVIVNSSTGPDEVGFYYADKSKQALVKQTGALNVPVVVDDASDFAPNDIVVVSTADTTTLANPVDPSNDAKLTTFDACILEIASISANTVTFATSGTWGTASNDHCANTTTDKTMIFGFVAHYWRIDPTRLPDGVLQLADNGNLVAADTFTDEAYGFTDLQVATYFYDNPTDPTDTDTDGDGARDWYSDGAQQTMTAPILTSATFTAPLVMAISFVARTDADVEGVYTTQTPDLVGTTGAVGHFMIGDHASVTLPSATDDRLKGKRIYRYITFRADLRNIGVGR